MQIAITISDEDVDEIDRFVPSPFRSRAEVVRAAVAEWISTRRSRDIDERYRQAYADVPQGRDDIDSGRGRRGQAHPWDELEW